MLGSNHRACEAALFSDLKRAPNPLKIRSATGCMGGDVGHDSRVMAQAASGQHGSHVPSESCSEFVGYGWLQNTIG